MLAALTCHFNPCKYINITNNYWRFRRELSKDVQLFTIELSFDNKFNIPDAFHVCGTEDNIMWQKERLLNILLEKVPKEFTKIAWIDNDLIFLNPNWHKETSHVLDSHPVAQLFQRAIRINHKGSLLYQPLNSVAFNMICDDPMNNSQCGYAWAARREIIESLGGLDDIHVIGSGDAFMMNAWLGSFNSMIIENMNRTWKKAYLNKAIDYYMAVQGDIGYVKGDIIHLYHGDFKNRNYIARQFCLSDYDYDPNKDIIKGPNGLWKWNTDKEEMIKRTKQYFLNRKEDD